MHSREKYAPQQKHGRDKHVSCTNPVASRYLTCGWYQVVANLFGLTKLSLVCHQVTGSRAYRHVTTPVERERSWVGHTSPAHTRRHLSMAFSFTKTGLL